MLVDWAIYGAIVAALTVLLNKTIFAKRGAPTPVLWALTIFMFVMNIAGMTALKLLRYEVLSQELGTQITAGNPIDMTGAVVMTMVFFYMLKRREKENVESNDATY
jgi:F0F1-type ATP synthase membrane subunit a